MRIKDVNWMAEVNGTVVTNIVAGKPIAVKPLI